MALTISDKQLEEIDSGGRPVLVWHSRTKKKYAVMPESAYDHVRPLIECMLVERTVPAEASVPTWSDAKNARRAALIHQKYDSKLTDSEKRELATLQEAVCRHQERVAPLQNHVELIVQALDQRAKNSPPRKRGEAGQSGTGIMARRKQAHGNQHSTKTDTAVGVDPE